MGSSMIELNGHSLTLEDIAKVAREGKEVVLERSAVSFVERGSRMVRSWVDQERSSTVSLPVSETLPVR